MTKLALEPDDEGSELAHDAIWTIYGFLISEQTSRRFDLVFSTAEISQKTALENTFPTYPKIPMNFPQIFP